MRAGLIGAVLLLAALLSGCAALARLDGFSNPTLLAIAPETLGERTVEQRLVIRWSGEARALEAVLEISAGKLFLALMSFGMRVSTLEYDGRTLVETRHLPQAPSGARMVNDLLMIAAPLEALQAALPEGWTVTESERQRTLAQNDKIQIVIRYAAATPWQGQVEFAQRALGYQLILDSHEF
ncbi:MAG: DUF3261 domain-containing protein [Zoogloeaceae bacterium]|nr:DUF3261 domain-containing protein [Zoogloeaceae bacterium]